MNFREKFQSYKDRILPLVDTMRDATEEATKNAFIMPFISLLGYDVFNPHEVIPEFTADVSRLCCSKRWRTYHFGRGKKIKCKTSKGTT